MKSIRVAAAIIRKEDKILAAQRGYGEFKDGWEFPGGKLRARRDGRAGLRARNSRRVARHDWQSLPPLTVEHDYETFHLSMECFLCEILDGTINDTEHENLRWLDSGHLWDVEWLPADIKVVEALEKRLSS